MRLLTPTEHKRFNELIGFLLITMAILVALSLISYNPHDVAFNVAGPPADGPLAHNWIGPVGAFSADGLFQVFGFAAFLLPAGVVVLGLERAGLGLLSLSGLGYAIRLGVEPAVTDSILRVPPPDRRSRAQRRLDCVRA